MAHERLRATRAGEGRRPPHRHRRTRGHRRRSPRRARAHGVHLLAHLVTHRARVLGREALLRDLWGRRGGATRTLDVHVRRLRAKLGSAAVIETVRGVGYRLVVPGATDPSTHNGAS
ncbi:MAG: helix-turn-helix domain-containing protein [Polyangiales bacterium]